MDPGRFAQFATRFSRYRLSRRAALGTGGAGLVTAWRVEPWAVVT